MKFKLFIFFILVYYSGFAKDDFQFTSPKFQKLDLKDGLTNLNVSSIVQDNLGYIWIATARGLNRFDGTSFKHYFFNEDENSLYHNWVTKLYKNCDGQIFCSTRYGLNLIDPDKDKMYRISSSNEFFIDFVEFDNNTYGISNLNGLCIYNKTDKSFSKLPTTDHDRIFNHLVSDKKSGIWAKSVENLTTVAPLSAPSLQTKNITINIPVLVNYNPDSNTFKKFVFPQSSESSYDSPMIKIDSILLITGKYFSAFNLRTQQFIPFPDKWNNLTDIKEFEIMFVKQIAKEILWIGTRTKGLFIFNLDKNTLVNLNKTNSDLNANWATCVFKDKDKNMWLGTFDHGVYIAFKDRSNINFDNTLNELTSDKFISSITSDLKQNYIIGTRYDGFYIYNNKNKKYKHFYVGNSFLTSNHIRTIFIDSKNKLWIASEKALHITDFKVHKSIDFYLPKPNFGMVSFCEQAGKVIASSDAQGFFIFDIDGTFLKQELKLGSNISQIIPVNRDELIVASFDNGILSYNVKSGAYKNIYKSKKSERYNLNQPITIYLDTDSILWIGNYVSGLYKLNLKNNSFKSYSMEDGLPNNDIVGIVQDSYGKLWLSTSYGLSRFDKKQEFVNYFYNEGLENIQFHAKAAHLDSKGIIYFGGNYGLSYFDPIVLSESEKKSAPKIILESLTVQNRLILPDDRTEILSTVLNNTSKIKLKHNQNTITIEYHAFDFVAADEIRYAYKLEGLDEQWNNVGKRSHANFSNLQSGIYNFNVKAKNNTGIWSEISSLTIEIKPSPFLTIWAFIIYFILISTITYVTFRLILHAKLYKNRLDEEHNERVRENEISQMKMRFFNNISHEIRTPLTLIKWNVDLFANELASRNEKPAPLNGLRYSVERLLNLVNQLLSVRKLENDALDLNVENTNIISITNKLIQPFMYVASSRQISIIIESNFDELFLPVDVDKYEKIMSNLLSNSLKFAKQGGFIKIKIDIPNDIREYFPDSKMPGNSFVKISVIDNGKGIPQKDLRQIFNRFTQSKVNKDRPDYSGTGIGLNFTKRLVELHHGAITATSTENVETIFSFVLSRDDKTYKDDIWISSKQKNSNQVLIDEDLVISVNTEDKQTVILIAEDDLELNRVITSFLKKHYKTISCYNGKEGLKLAHNHLPDIIISDIVMPEMDGFTFCKSIREDDVISHIPIILLTSKTDAESKIAGYNCGADEYVSKPFDLNILRVRINNIIELRKKLHVYYKQGILNEHHTAVPNQYELNFIKQIESIVSQYYQSTDLNVIFLSKKMNMSRTSLYRRFMGTMKISPKDFITKYRIKKSIELMERGNNNFGEISYLCGFGSQSNFSVLFKKEKGVTPLQFKKSL